MPIGHFDLATGLGMIGGSKPMDYGIPFQQGIKRPIIEMGPLITNDSSRHAKSSKDVLPKDLHNNLSIISSRRDALTHLEAYPQLTEYSHSQKMMKMVP